MTTEKRNPAPRANEGDGANGSGQLTGKYITKDRTVLKALMESANGLTGREAWKLYGDSCLNTTISKLQQKYGIRVDRELIDADGRYGPVKIARYWLSPGEKAKARKILGRGREAA